MVPLIVCIVLMVIAYIVLQQVVKNTYIKTGNYIKTGKLLPAIAGFGILLVGLTIGGFDGADPMFIPLGLGVAAVATLLMAVLNIKAAGVGTAILLALLQAVCGVAILVIAVVSIALRMAGVQLGGTTSKTVPSSWEADRAAQQAQWEAERAKAEGYAHHDGFDSLQDAVDTGEADPNLLKKD